MLELADAGAFVLRAAGAGLHPLHLGLGLVAALAASWTLPLPADALAPWGGVGPARWLGTLGAGAWLVLTGCVAGVVVCRRTAAARSSAGVWRCAPRQVAAAALAVALAGVGVALASLAAWAVVAAGGAIGGGVGAALATLAALCALLVAAVTLGILALCVPAIAANDADAPDALQRAAAHAMSRPDLALVLGGLALALALGVWTLGHWGVALAHASVDAGWQDNAPGVGWLAHTVALALALPVGWAAMTAAVLAMREASDGEDRDACWDADEQAEQLRIALEARAIQTPGGLAERLRADAAQRGGS